MEQPFCLIPRAKPCVTLCTLWFTVLFLSLIASPAWATDYYISPSGNNSNSGLSASAPWKTFGRVFNTSNKVLQPGDTLILLDGIYTKNTTGLPSLTCGTNAVDGTANAPITIKAANERRAHLSSDGSQSGFYMQDCDYYNVEGLYASSADLSVAQGGSQAGGYPFLFATVTHVNARRLLADHNNRYFNTHIIAFNYSQHVLIEECEAYAFHRHAISTFQSRYMTVRRCYANSMRVKDIADGYRSNSIYGDVAVTFYGSSDSIMENNISENGANGFVIDGTESAADPGGGGQRNKILGSVSYEDQWGVVIGSRTYTSGSVTETHNGKDNQLENVVVANGGKISLNFAANAIIRNSVIYNGSGGGFTAYSFDGWNCQSDTHRCVSAGTVCTSNAQCSDNFCMRNLDGCYFTAQNDLFFKNTTYVGFQTRGQTSALLIDNVNSVDNPASDWYFASGYGGYNGHSSESKTDDAGNIRQSISTTPTHMGLGSSECIMWVPANSNMKGAGRNGADIGANILYAYENGALTSKPLWRANDGRFLGCGAEVPGVNDNAATSCKGISARLNINQNGCAFPAGYVGWGGTATPPSAPGGLRIVQ